VAHTANFASGGKMNTTDKLNQLKDLRFQSDVIRLHFDDLRRSILTPEIQAALDDIDAEYRTANDALQSGIAELEKEIKEDVLTKGETVKGDGIMAVWNKGRESWDGKSLSGYAAAHPEILAFRKIGEPSVSIR
jgi:hypothetical protein